MKIFNVFKLLHLILVCLVEYQEIAPSDISATDVGSENITNKYDIAENTIPVSGQKSGVTSVLSSSRSSLQSEAQSRLITSPNENDGLDNENIPHVVNMKDPKLVGNEQVQQVESSTSVPVIDNISTKLTEIPRGSGKWMLQVGCVKDKVPETIKVNSDAKITMEEGQLFLNLPDNRYSAVREEKINFQEVGDKTREHERPVDTKSTNSQQIDHRANFEKYGEPKKSSEKQIDKSDEGLSGKLKEEQNECMNIADQNCSQGKQTDGSQNMEMINIVNKIESEKETLNLKSNSNPNVKILEEATGVYECAALLGKDEKSPDIAKVPDVQKEMHETGMIDTKSSEYIKKTLILCYLH